MAAFHSPRAGGGNKPTPVKECGRPAVTAPLTMPASSLECWGHGAMLALKYVVGKSVFITAGVPLWKKSSPVSNSIQTWTRDRISLADTGHPS